MQEPTPEQYNPPLTWRSHAWRTAGALSISAVLWPTTAAVQWHQARPLFWLDLTLGLLTLVLSFGRRRWPFAVASLCAVLGAVSVSSAGPGVLASVSLATRRHVPQIVAVGVLGLVGAVAYPMVGPSATDDPWWITFAFGLAFTVAMLVWGMYLGSRRELLWTLRDRAERAEAEQGLRVEQGRSTERARIAREMHDVLAHRLSLVALHAGALEYCRSLSDAEVAKAAAITRQSAHSALDELHEILGVLRTLETDASPERPQPTLADLPALVQEAIGSGTRVRLHNLVGNLAEAPDAIGRGAYRMIQESLTNARKHAPDTAVDVTLSGRAGGQLMLEVRNPLRLGSAVSATPGSGLGLLGLTERAELIGGRLEHVRLDGDFVVRAWLPWPA